MNVVSTYFLYFLGIKIILFSFIVKNGLARESKF